MLFDDPFYYETTWGILINTAVGRIPFLLVLLTALILSLICFGRHRGPAVLVIIATLLSMVMMFTWPFANQAVMDRLYMGDGDPDTLRWLPATLNFVYSTAQAVCWLLLVVAAFTWRRRTGTVAATAGGMPLGVAAAASPYAGQSNPAANGTDATVAAATSIRKMTKGGLWTMIACQIIGLVLVIPGFALTMTAGNRDDEQIIAGAVITCASCIPLLVGAILLMVLIYRLWAAIQSEQSRTTPGLAVGLLFVPLFNFYWVFQVYWGWAVDYNRLADARGVTVRPASQGLGLALSICIVVSAIPFVGLLMTPINLILLPVFLNGAINSVNALATVAPAMETTAPPTSPPGG